MRDLKVGDRVEAVRNGVDYREDSGAQTGRYVYKVGDIGAYIHDNGGDLDVRFDYGVITGCASSSFVKFMSVSDTPDTKIWAVRR